VELAGTLIDFFPASSDWVPAPGSGGQHHAYIIDLEAFDPWVRHFEASGVATRLTTHGFNRMSMYVDDPDGYHIELTVVLPDRDTAAREFEKRGLEVSWFQMAGTGQN
jgi:hypothetical protein